MDNNNLGVILRERRKERELTLVDVSRLSGLHLAHIAHIERGERFPTGRTLKKLAKPMGFSEIELFKLAGLLSSDKTSDVPLLSMLTVSDVARLFSIHTNTVRRWSNQGILKVYRIGPRGDRRFRRQDIDSFLMKSKQGYLSDVSH